MNYGSCFPIPGEIKTKCLSVALFQMPVKKAVTKLDDIPTNVAEISKWMRRTVIGLPGVDLMVTPETALHGFSPTAHNYPVTLDDDNIAQLKAVCKELRVWLVFGAYIDLKNGEPVQNAAITINDKGEIVNVYTKTNPWNPIEPTYPGSEIKVFDGPKGSRIATIICSDGDYIDTWKEAAYKKANVIIRISAYMTPYERVYETTNKAGAYFNKCYVLSTNECGLDDAYCWFGNSMAVNPDGDIYAQAPLQAPYTLKCDVYPGLADAIQKQALMGDLNYLGNHRGGTNPNAAHGKKMGFDKSLYDFKKEEK